MFEKFTQKAIEIVTQAQDEAKRLGHSQICSEHILLALYIQTKGVSAKMLDFDKIDRNKLNEKICLSIGAKINPCDFQVVFSKSAQDILDETIKIAKEYNSSFIIPQHVALALFCSKNSGAYKIIQEFDLDENKVVSSLKSILNKNKKSEFKHPEAQVENSAISFKNINNFFKEKNVSEILKNATSKLSTCGYEILGTEQILQSILENEELDFINFLKQNNIDKDQFSEKLSGFSDRNAEFEDSENKIIFTPNAFKAMLLAIDSAKELGSVEIKPEHIILGMIKAKTGIAYHILKDLNSDVENLENKITGEITKKTHQMLSILRFAKKEAKDLNISNVGTEMLLLGILDYGTGIGASVLHKLGITLKDVRREISELIKSSSSSSDAPFNYTVRAKKVLEIAYENAKFHNRQKVASENLLYAITKQGDCLAMKILENLGTDVIEIKYGIKREIELINSAQNDN